MLYVLVKFTHNPEPEIFGTMHVSFAACLATMEGVEWVSPTILNGNAIEFPVQNGGNCEQGPSGDRQIRGYTPKPLDAFEGHQGPINTRT